MEEQRFWSLELEKKNKQDLQNWIDENKLVGLVDEEKGGIIGYINPNSINEILKKLNQITK